MVSDQQCDSHEGRFRQVSLECFIVDRSTPCLRGVGVKAQSGKEDTTLLSMADCCVKQTTVSTATRYGIKPRIQGCPRGSVRMGGQSIRYHKKKKTIALIFLGETCNRLCQTSMFAASAIPLSRILGLRCGFVIATMQSISSGEIICSR